jgi:hypothetical protein
MREVRQQMQFKSESEAHPAKQDDFVLLAMA